MLQVTEAYLAALAAAAVAASPGIAGPLSGAKLHLATAGPTPGLRSAVADFTEATYASYAAAPITWGAPWRNPEGEGEVDGGVIQFVLAADLTPPATITHYFLTNTAGSVLLAAEQLATPAELAFQGDSISIPLRFTLPGNTQSNVPLG